MKSHGKPLGTNPPGAVLVRFRRASTRFRGGSLAGSGPAIGAALKAQIANFKVPKAVFVCPDLPRNAMGKVQKNLLREQHRELFGKA